KLFHWWPSHREVQLASHLQDRIPHRLCFQADPIHSPQILVLGIHLGIRGIPLRRLLINSASKNEAMKLLKGTAILKKPTGQPVQQLRVTRRTAHAPKIVGRVYQASPEVIVPDPIYDGTPRKTVF